MITNVIYDPIQLSGSISATYACTHMKFELEVIGTHGTLHLSRNVDKPGYHLKVDSVKEGKSSSSWEEDFGFGGIELEFLGFAAHCQQLENDCNTPLEALKDLAFVEACLESGKKNGDFVILKEDDL
uniref:Gfo/Idh/MocA-like oxidoreductase C-terminal domain-containing protein n=1 Tax=Ditylum brightwellii TaxID=49249 RepID=A0A7S1ZI66_9STRA|mmetsp:Transcript_32364/g.48257  ORF Transcript_32364/g.48257 Transcript_32364/m.48257 type:complete len:127 (+) Transcript_32364:2-382(+)